MADLGAEYTLNLPSLPDIVFNQNGLQFGDGRDGYYLTNITGLDGAPLRTPIDNRPQTDGGLVHDFYKGPRLISFEGLLLVQTVFTQDGIVAAWESMTATLIAGLESIIRADATLSWTPQGQSAKSLTVRYNVPIETTWQPSFKTFTFGLVSANPDPT